MLSAEGLGLAGALAAFAAAREEAGGSEEEGGAASAAVDGDFGGGGEGVEFVAYGGCWGGLDVEEEEALGGVAAGVGVRGCFGGLQRRGG